MTAPKTKDFAAWINLMPGAPHALIVTGEVETNAGDHVPILTRATSQGTISQYLLLDLSIRDQGTGGTDDVAFRSVRYSEPAEKGQFHTVEIFWEGTSILSIPVTEAH